MQRISDDAYRSYIHSLDVATQPAQPATGAWQLAADHRRAATDPRPAPIPQLLQPAGDSPGAAADPGTPFPALRAAADPTRITLLPQPATEPAHPTSRQSPAGTGGGSLPAGDGPAAVAAATAAEGNAAEGDEDGPQINVLGPIEVTGLGSSGHDPKLAVLAALIYLRRGKNSAALGEAMSPLTPWSQSTVQSRITALRSACPTGRPATGLRSGKPPRDCGISPRTSPATWSGICGGTCSGWRMATTQGAQERCLNCDHR